MAHLRRFDFEIGAIDNDIDNDNDAVIIVILMLAKSI